MPNGVRQGEVISYKPSDVNADCFGETFEPVLDNA